MKARRARSDDARRRPDTKRSDGAAEAKVLKPRALPRTDAQRIERILKWEEDSAAAEFLIAGPRVARVDPE